MQDAFQARGRRDNASPREHRARFLASAELHRVGSGRSRPFATGGWLALCNATGGRSYRGECLGREEGDFQVEDRSAPTHRILVVDDEELVRWALSQRLEERGYKVLEASDATSAAAAAGEADLVLLEQELRDGVGADLAVWLRSEKPQRPLILMTAYSAPEVEQLAREGLVEAIVEKPFGLDEVLDLIGQCLRRATGDDAGGSG